MVGREWLGGDKDRRPSVTSSRDGVRLLAHLPVTEFNYNSDGARFISRPPAEDSPPQLGVDRDPVCTAYLDTNRSRSPLLYRRFQSILVPLSLVLALHERKARLGIRTTSHPIRTF